MKGRDSSGWLAPLGVPVSECVNFEFPTTALKPIKYLEEHMVLNMKTGNGEVGQTEN
jgi:hypothetical protein